MSLYNTAFDAANTSVRAFLTKVGEFYLGRSFNTSTGPGKKDWDKIKDEVFNGTCAYCGKIDLKLQMDHLIMFNRTGYGLHHPGNIVPSCSKCNTRSKKGNGDYTSWEEHLSVVCEENGEKNNFFDRWTKIKKHISEGQYAYPKLTSEEEKEIRIIANRLYKNVKDEFDSSIELYQELNTSFSKSSR
jgi:hypothetical protein